MRLSDLLPSRDTLAKWVDHLHRHEAALTKIAETFAWPAQPRETLQVAARIYCGQRPGAVLWRPGGVHAATGAELQAIDELLSAA